MNKTIFRIDDVTKNSDVQNLNGIVCAIREQDPLARIWLCVTLFSKKNEVGSVYPNPPFKHRPSNWFYHVDDFSAHETLNNLLTWDFVDICSHGLWHVDHSMISEELQRASILTSCTYLNTKTFVPPFNKWNDKTAKICADNDIELIRYEDGWKSLEFNDYDEVGKKWYFHAWKLRSAELRKVLKGEAI